MSESEGNMALANTEHRDENGHLIRYDHKGRAEPPQDPRLWSSAAYEWESWYIGGMAKEQVPPEEHQSFLSMYDLTDEKLMMRNITAGHREKLAHSHKDIFLKMLTAMGVDPDRSLFILRAERKRLKPIFKASWREAMKRGLEVAEKHKYPIMPEPETDYGDRVTATSLVAKDLNQQTKDVNRRIDEHIQKVKIDIPAKVEFCVVGAGMTGCCLAQVAKVEEGIDGVHILEKSEYVGGVWRLYANSYSRVNSSEPVYRLPLKRNKPRAEINTNHTPTFQMLEDLLELIQTSQVPLCMLTKVDSVRPLPGGPVKEGYEILGTQRGNPFRAEAKLVALATNRRLGSPLDFKLPNEDSFVGLVRRGLESDCEDESMAWDKKRVCIIGMGAFALEHVRTALERGASHCSILARERGTVCPQLIDWINFIRPFNDKFEHPIEGSVISMEAWRGVYKNSGAATPECWDEKPMILKPDGQTVSTSDAFFVAHKLGMCATVLGNASKCTEDEVHFDAWRLMAPMVPAESGSIKADVIIKCVGFTLNETNTKIINRTHMRGNGLVDHNLWLMIETHLDAKIFSSVFGSSYLNGGLYTMRLMSRLYKDPLLQTSFLQKMQPSASINGLLTSHRQSGARH